MAIHATNRQTHNTTECKHMQQILVTQWRCFQGTQLSDECVIIHRLLVKSHKAIHRSIETSVILNT